MMNLGRYDAQVNGNSRALYYRVDSLGDRGSLDGVFNLLDYNLDKFKICPAIEAFYHKILEDGKKPFIIDAGANIGGSVNYLDMRWPGSKFFCVEPERHNFALLTLNAADIDAELFRGGLDCQDGQMYLHDPKLGDMGFRVAASGSEKIPTICANTILAQAPEDCVPFLFKIDIEGSEQALFSKNSEWITRFPVLMIEIHDWMLPFQNVSRQVFRQILEHNFDVLLMRGNVFFVNTDMLRSHAATVQA